MKYQIIDIPVFQYCLYFLKFKKTSSYADTFFLKCHSVLTPTQYGFRPKYLTLHALLDITTSALGNIKKNYILGLYF